MTCLEIIKKLGKMSDESIAVFKRKRGSEAKNVYGIMVKDLRIIAKKIGKNHKLALELFASDIHEAKKLASMIDDPVEVTEDQMEKWVTSFDSWDVCDCCCSSLFVKTKFAYTKALEWSKRSEEYVKRAAFTLMAHLVFFDKSAQDIKFEQFFPVIRREVQDNRNFVKKAVNWALRQIGKRNMNLNRKAIKLAKEIQQIESKSAQWIANNALQELTRGKINILGYPRQNNFYRGREAPDLPGDRKTNQLPKYVDRMETNNKIIIRSPLPGELGWIIQVHGQYYAKKFGWLDEFECIVAKIIVDYLNCEQHDRQACFIAELGGKPVGCIMLMTGREMEGKLRVMFVSEEARGKGIGRLLIQSVFEKAKSIGYKSISLWTTNNQHTARELYKKHGFSLISATPNETFAKGSNDELWKAEL